MVPKRSTARSTIALPPSGVATVSWQATALPPAAVISRATASAAEPSGLPTPPMSLTITLAPRRPSSSA